MLLHKIFVVCSSTCWPNSGFLRNAGKRDNCTMCNRPDPSSLSKESGLTILLWPGCQCINVPFNQTIHLEDSNINEDCESATSDEERDPHTDDCLDNRIVSV